MRRPIFFLLILMFLVPVPVQAGRRIEIRLRIPQPLTSGHDLQTIVIGRITDNRRFVDRPAQASTPSIAEFGVGGTNAKQRSFYIARVRDGFGKARHNIFLVPNQPVEEVVRELLTRSLAAEGYKVVNDPNRAGARSLTMDVDIDQLWGYIVTGLEWGGAVPVMAGQIRTILKVRGPDGTKDYEVNGSTLHRFFKMTREHWVQTFEELFLDYQGNLARLRF